MDYDETQTRLLDAAARLLIRFGYDKTTLDDVASEAGLSRSTLYSRWKKKDVLFRALLWREILNYLDDFIARLEKDQDAGSLAGFFRVAMEAIHESAFIMTIYTRERQILGTALLNDNMTQLYQWRIGATASFMAVLQKVGMIRADVDLNTLSYMLSCLQLGILKMSEVVPPDQSPSVDQIMEQSMIMIGAFAPDGVADEETGRVALLDYVRTLRQHLESLREAISPKG